MQKLTIVGGKKLNGSITISGSKNATLPILAASILSKNKIIIQIDSDQIPHLRANLNSTLRLIQASYDSINSVKI